MLILKNLNRLRMKKFDILLLSTFKVNKNNVKMLKIFWGPKMHSRWEIFKKIFIFNFYGNTICFLIF
jgi:hypothetical protein